MPTGSVTSVEGTPALFVNGERVDGAVPEDQLWLVIDRALRAAGIDPPPAVATPANPPPPPPGTGK